MDTVITKRPGGGGRGGGRGGRGVVGSKSRGETEHVQRDFIAQNTDLLKIQLFIFASIRKSSEELTS